MKVNEAQAVRRWDLGTKKPDGSQQVVEAHRASGQPPRRPPALDLELEFVWYEVVFAFFEASYAGGRFRCEKSPVGGTGRRRSAVGTRSVAFRGSAVMNSTARSSGTARRPFPTVHSLVQIRPAGVRAWVHPATDVPPIPAIAATLPTNAPATRANRASRSMQYVWWGEVVAGGEGARLLGVGSKGTFQMPAVFQTPGSILNVRLLAINANGKAYELDRVYQIIQ